MRGRGRAGRALLDAARTIELDAAGTRVTAVVNERRGGRLIVIVPGWLGKADTPYVRRAAAVLHDAGFSVARLLLRSGAPGPDLPPSMFASAGLEEVVAATDRLVRRFGARSAGLLGYSLGGNLVLRAAAHRERAPELRACLAVCPLVDFAPVVDALDRGPRWVRGYFLRKWRRALAATAGDANADGLADVGTIGELCERLVRRSTGRGDARDALARYRLHRETLAALPAATQIVATLDDPVIPVESIRSLVGDGPPELVVTSHGGHCGFIEDFRLRAAIDRHVERFFSSRLAPDAGGGSGGP